MAATDVTHKFIEGKPRLAGKVGAGGVASPSATTVPHTFVGLTEGNVYVVTANRTNATGTTKNPVSSTETFIGKVSSANFINCVRAVEGSAQAWAADTVLEILFTATGWNKMIEGIEAEHNQDGTHKTANVVTPSATQTLTNKTLTSPKIDTGINDTNGNELVKVTPVASAVNEITISNNATGAAPIISATGGDANIDLSIVGKGTGRVTIQGKKRVTAITSHATPTINTDNCDVVDITALAEAITSMTTNLSGTPTNFQTLIIRIKDNGIARAITWGASFEAKGVALPTTTVISKVLTVGFIYDTTTSKWGCVASQQEA